MPNEFSRYDVYSTAESIYCYRGTTVLRNRFGIRNLSELKTIEADITTIRQHNLLLRGISGRFTPNHLCSIHRYIFGDIYSFAGHYRREQIAKGQTVFENPDGIQQKLSALLNQLKAEHYLREFENMAFVTRLAYYFSELNYLHPFREGNGRATREFIRQLLLFNGYEIDWGAVSVERLLDSMMESVYDTDRLVAALMVCIQKL